jgi:hypothetical protein
MRQLWRRIRAVALRPVIVSERSKRIILMTGWAGMVILNAWIIIYNRDNLWLTIPFVLYFGAEEVRMLRMVQREWR